MHPPGDLRRAARVFCSAEKICIITAWTKRFFGFSELLQEGTRRMRYSAVVFDLDGTLLDTLADIADAANRVLVKHGLAAHELDSYRQFVGEGVRVLFERSLPREACTSERVTACADDFRQAYAECWNIRTHPYDGVEELLSALVDRNVRLAVLSNKPDNFTKACVREYFPKFSFEAVLGQRDGVPRKPDPAGALEIAADHGPGPGPVLVRRRHGRGYANRDWPPGCFRSGFCGAFGLCRNCMRAVPER